MERTWILVCNSGGARLYRARPHELELLEEIEHAAGRLRGAELTSDRAGRTRKSLGRSPRAALDAPMPPRAAEARRFARTLVHRLEDARAAGSFDRLVLMAPPHFLGIVLEILPRALRRMLAASLPRDYLRATGDRIHDALRDVRAI